MGSNILHKTHKGERVAWLIYFMYEGSCLIYVIYVCKDISLVIIMEYYGGLQIQVYDPSRHTTLNKRWNNVVFLRWINADFE
jgi:hypothetical protein